MSEHQLRFGMWSITVRRAKRVRPWFGWTFSHHEHGKWLACNIGRYVVGVTWPWKTVKP